jgi:hypothetical protein
MRNAVLSTVIAATAAGVVVFSGRGDDTYNETPHWSDTSGNLTSIEQPLDMSMNVPRGDLPDLLVRPTNDRGARITYGASQSMSDMGEPQGDLRSITLSVEAPRHVGVASAAITTSRN